MSRNEQYIFPVQQARVNRERRYLHARHTPVVLWLTGLSGAGKSTLAYAIESRLLEMGCHSYVLDGDNVRTGLCADLGFSAEDRSENIRRIAETARLMVDAGLIVMAAFISPFRADRLKARALLAGDDFIEMYCATPLAVCEQRDVKGLYQKARAGEVKHFTGISSPYEPPLNPELVVDTGSQPIEVCVQQVLDYLCARGILRMDQGQV